MKKLYGIALFICVVTSMNLFSSVHEERMKLRNELFGHKQVVPYLFTKTFGCMLLLLSPVSWQHVVTVPCQQQEPIIETPGELFVKNCQKSQGNSNFNERYITNLASRKHITFLPIKPEDQHAKTQKYDCPEDQQKRNHKKNLRKK